MGKKTAGTTYKASCSSKTTALDIVPDSLLPSWPSLPKGYNMSLLDLLPNYIWVVPNFFTSHECQNWVDFVEKSCTMEYVSQRGTRYLAARECYRTQIDNADMATRIFDRLLQCPSLIKAIPPHPIACNPNLRIYKYLKGHSFGKHIDESHHVGRDGITKLTILIYLSSCQGGATRFDTPLGKEVSFTPKAGAMLLHLHGDDCLMHQAGPVLSGTKYVLRTDLVYER